MKVIIAIISLLCMIVPTPCQVAKCKIEETQFGYDTETKDGKKNPLCESLLKQAKNMKDAEVCANSASLNEVQFTQLILSKCADTIAKADNFPSSARDKNTAFKTALDCSVRTTCSAYSETHLEKLRRDWADKQMLKCLQDSEGQDYPAADNCVSSERPLDCEKQENVKECKDFYVRFEALNKVCKSITSSSACKWKTPKQLTQEKLRECFLNLECHGKNSKNTLSEGCLKRCYDIKDDKEAQLQDKLDKCFTSKDCDGAPTKKATTASTTPAPGPAPSTIKPADQGNDDQKPTSMGPKDQDVTSDEDEGCMVRANKKIIIAFAATFVIISFLKALPVES